MDSGQFDLALKVIGIVILVLAVLFVLTWSGVVKCKDISPYWCEAYDLVAGGPRVLIVHGDAGLGSPDKLKLYLQDPRYVGATTVDIQHIDQISLGNLKKYKLVIVEQARKLSADQLFMFMEYVNKNGGRLVWVGDAGVEAGDGESRQYYDTVCNRNTVGIRTTPPDAFGTAPETVDCNDKVLKMSDNPWFRIKENDVEYRLINFDEFLGIKYLDTFCNEVNCAENFYTVGTLESESTGNHPLIFGTSPTLAFKIKLGRDFALVKQIPDSAGSNIVLSLNQGGLTQGSKFAIPRNIPFIVTSSIGLGERVAYYAYPPEWFLEDNNYFYYIKNLYTGMLGR